MSGFVEVYVYRRSESGSLVQEEGHACSDWSMACQVLTEAGMGDFESIKVAEAGKVIREIKTPEEASRFVSEMKEKYPPLKTFGRYNALTAL